MRYYGVSAEGSADGRAASAGIRDLRDGQTYSGGGKAGFEQDRRGFCRRAEQRNRVIKCRPRERPDSKNATCKSMEMQASKIFCYETYKLGKIPLDVRFLRPFRVSFGKVFFKNGFVLVFFAKRLACIAAASALSLLFYFSVQTGQLCDFASI